VHRVFLQLADDFPDVRKLAAARSQAFIDTPLARTRAHTSDLGDLIMYLVVDFDHTWSGALAEKWMIESVRRAAYQMGDAAKTVHRVGGGPDDVDELLRFWAEHTSGGKVSTFCLTFLELVARPPGMDNAAAIKRDIDSRWGHVRASTLAEMRRVCAELQAGSRSVPAIMSGLLGRPVSPGAAAELIMWGFSEARADEERRTPRYIDMPTGEGEFVAAWRERSSIWRAAFDTPAADLAPAADAADESSRKRKTLPGVCRSLRVEYAKSRVTLPPPGTKDSMSIRGEIVHVACTCDKCAYQTFLAESRAAWNGTRRSDAADDDDAAAAVAAADEKKMFIGGLSAQSDLSKLRDILVEHGGDGGRDLQEIETVRDTVTGKLKPYVFVRFASRVAVFDAMRSIRVAHEAGRVGRRTSDSRAARNSSVREPFPALDVTAAGTDDGDDNAPTGSVRSAGRFWFQDKPIVFDIVRHVQPRWMQH
jgi:hypothetical protein